MQGNPPPFCSDPLAKKKEKEKKNVEWGLQFSLWPWPHPWLPNGIARIML